MPQYGMLEYKITLARIGHILLARVQLYGGIAQFGRASDLHSEGRRFEPDYLHSSLV